MKPVNNSGGRFVATLSVASTRQQSMEAYDTLPFELRHAVAEAPYLVSPANLLKGLRMGYDVEEVLCTMDKKLQREMNAYYRALERGERL